MATVWNAKVSQQCGCAPVSHELTARLLHCCLYHYRLHDSQTAPSPDWVLCCVAEGTPGTGPPGRTRTRKQFSLQRMHALSGCWPTP